MRASTSCASARYGWRSSPRSATRIATSNWPVRRSASASGRKTRLDGSRARSSLKRRISSAIVDSLQQRAQPHNAVEHLAHACYARTIARFDEVSLPRQDRLVHPGASGRSRAECEEHLRVARLELRGAPQCLERVSLPFETHERACQQHLRLGTRRRRARRSRRRGEGFGEPPVTKRLTRQLDVRSRVVTREWLDDG